MIARRYKVSGVGLGVAVLAAALAVPVRAAWVVTEVPMLPHWTGGVEVSGINDSGVVCGSGNYVVNVSSTVFRFDGVTVTELPHLVPADPISLATGINAAGVICGYGHNASGDSQAVYWEGMQLHTIPYPPDANTNSDLRAYDLNDAGTIVGYFWNLAGRQTAFYFKDGVSYNLAPAIEAAGLSGQEYAYAVNNADVVCGIADNAVGVSHSWTYAIATGTLTVIGIIGTDDCSAVDINLHGQTIGRGKQTSADINRAVTYDGAWHLVDPAVSTTQWGEAINDHGRMVGHAATGGSKYSWYSDGPGPGSAKTLTLSGWSRVTAQAINNNDWIAGYGWTSTSGSYNRGFIIAPPPGDIDHDGDVDSADYWLLLAAYGHCTPDPLYNVDADFDEDGCVSLADYQAWLLGYLADNGQPFILPGPQPGPTPRTRPAAGVVLAGGSPANPAEQNAAGRN